MSTAIDTFGTSISINATDIGQVQDIDGPNLSTDTDEITNHSSPDGVEEFIATIKRTGEISFPVVFDPQNASQISVLTAWENKTLDAYVITFPDGSTWGFDAYVIGFANTAPVAGHLSADVTLRPSGAPVFTPAAP